MDVTGTPVSSQLLYHNPATAVMGRISMSHPFLSPKENLRLATRHRRAMPPRAVENTRAVGLYTRVSRYVLTAMRSQGMLGAALEGMPEGMPGAALPAFPETVRSAVIFSRHNAQQIKSYIISWCSNVILSLLAVAAMFMMPGIAAAAAAAHIPRVQARLRLVWTRPWLPCPLPPWLPRPLPPWLPCPLPPWLPYTLLSCPPSRLTICAARNRIPSVHHQEKARTNP